MLALETIPDVREAEALLIALDGIGVPAWLSYTVDGDHTRAGQSLEQAGAIARDQPGIIAVGVNCSAPADAVAAVGVLARRAASLACCTRTAARRGTPAAGPGAAGRMPSTGPPGPPGWSAAAVG